MKRFVFAAFLWVSLAVYVGGGSHAAMAQDGAARSSQTGNLDTPPTSYLLVELSGNAKMIGYPAVCPGTSPEEDQSDIICMAELYEVPVRVLENLGGEETARKLTIRFTAHSLHAVWKRKTRFVLGVVPFEDQGDTGHFAFSWDWENDRGELCIGNEELDDAEPALRHFYRRGSVRKAGSRNSNWERGFPIACTWANPKRGR